MCTHKGIDVDDGGRVRARRACRLSNDGGGVGRGRGIDNASKGSETMPEAAGARQRAWGTYKDDRGVGGGRRAQIIQQRQRRRWRRIDDASKVSDMTMEVASDWRRAWWIFNNNGVLILLAIRFLTMTLFYLCLIAVSFWYCFHQIPFFRSLQKIPSVLQLCGKYFCTKCTLTLSMYPLRTGE